MGVFDVVAMVLNTDRTHNSPDTAYHDNLIHPLSMISAFCGAAQLESG